MRHACERVPYYREWMRAAGAHWGDFRSPKDLCGMPAVDKLALTVDPDQFAAEGYEQRDGLTLWSSGTSGRRRRFRYDSAALFTSLAAGRRQRLVLAHFVGSESGYREAIFNRAGNVGEQIRQFYEDRTMLSSAIGSRASALRFRFAV